MAITHFARAIGAARSGDPAAARADVAKLAELRDSLREAKNNYWADQVDVQEQVANAWILYADGKYDDALKAMSAAADAEDKTEKSPVTPGPLAPARELYGFMLLDRGMAKEALAAFEATMAKEPNRFNGYVGAAKAAQALGDTAKAKANYEKLLASRGRLELGAAGACRGSRLRCEQLERDAKPKRRHCGGSGPCGRRARRPVDVLRLADAGAEQRGDDAEPSEIFRSAMAVPDRRVGQGQSLSLRGGGLRRRGQSLRPRQDRLLQLQDRRLRRHRTRSSERLQADGRKALGAGRAAARSMSPG